MRIELSMVPVLVPIPVRTYEIQIHVKYKKIIYEQISTFYPSAKNNFYFTMFSNKIQKCGSI
jgi:hypothetical protein